VAQRRAPSAAVIGPARVDRRTKDLIPRLRPGDVAVIDHEDLDRVAAEGLVESGIVAVVNAAQSISGRYPNVGPLLVAAAGIALVDGVGGEIMTSIREGDVVRVEGDRVVVRNSWIVTGQRQTIATLEEQFQAARDIMGGELERFAENTLDYMRRERHLFLDAPVLPDLDVPIAGRHVLLVVRGPGYREDLAALRQGGYMRDLRPILIGVDGGADALLEMGCQPDVIIGDFDSVSERALRSGAELVVHAYPGGEAPGADRLRGLGLAHAVFESAGTSEDIAMLLAHERGAELIVAVGTHSSMVEFLEKGRSGMASTFLVRLRVGPILVDAKGVNRLYQRGVRTFDLLLLSAAALFALLVVTAVSQPARLFLRNLWTLLGG